MTYETTAGQKYHESTGSLEKEQFPQSHLDKKFSTNDMLKAFKHGREFEQLNEDCDMICESMPTKNLPFYEWLARFQENRVIHGK